ncbi:glyoxalase [Endozoicomonas sp. OPT23]|uniref:VOC family protein n=1 Tax=Endozoicomonas sp. OPT23 TaxID=2072845 RepID=UPI00129A2D9E|nr:VOC family protein [Endozoicomonas sp. OPT23]MRI34908.1 glyoxalase [Endozoicomonas sp. OPT23]
MISNVLLGSNDLKKAEVFYDELLVIFDAKQTMNTEKAILWKSEDGSVGIAVCKPHDGLVATSGNGSMVGLKADSKEMAIAVYENAISLGESCGGAPGERRTGVFAAYFRDLDKNKFGIFYVSS